MTLREPSSFSARRDSPPRRISSVGCRRGDETSILISLCTSEMEMDALHLITVWMPPKILVVLQERELWYYDLSTNFAIPCTCKKIYIYTTGMDTVLSWTMPWTRLNLRYRITLNAADFFWSYDGKNFIINQTAENGQYREVMLTFFINKKNQSL